MTTLQLITSSHTTTHNTLQASVAVEDTYDYYYATDDFMDSLVNQIKAEGNIFAAMRRVEEINSLNGYKVIPDYQVWEIKSTFKNRNIKNQSGDSQKVDNEIDQRQRGNYNKQNDHFIKEYQKAYMRMLSI